MTMSEYLRYREDLSPERFYEIYYADSGIDKILLIELLELAASELCMPVGRLRPEDRFSVELAPRKGDEWDSGYGILLREIARSSKRKGRKIQHNIATLDDYLRIMAELY